MRGSVSGMDVKPGQYTLRRLFVIITCWAIVLTVAIGIARFLQQTIDSVERDARDYRDQRAKDARLAK